MNSLDIVKADGSQICAGAPALTYHGAATRIPCPSKAALLVDGMALCRAHAAEAVLRAAETELGL